MLPEHLEIEVVMRKLKQWILVMFSILITASACTCAAANSHGPTERLISKLILVESSGQDNAIGDKKLVHKAYGPLQIRQQCVDDVNKRYRTNYRSEDCLGNRKLSVEIFRRYVTMYATEKRLGRAPTDEDYARIWNGGPNGWKSSATIAYAAKVRKAEVFLASKKEVPRYLAVN